jgi:hypothetical protein
MIIGLRLGYRQAEVWLLSVGLGDCLVQSFESSSSECSERRRYAKALLHLRNNKQSLTFTEKLIADLKLANKNAEFQIR